MTKNDADPHFLLTAQLRKFLLRSTSVSNASADNPTSLYDCSSSQSLENLARLPPRSLAVQQEPTTYWVADGSGSTFWTDKLANSHFARFRVQTHACGTSTKQRRSYAQRRHCRALRTPQLSPARRHERSSSSPRHEGLLIDVLGGRRPERPAPPAVCSTGDPL